MLKPGKRKLIEAKILEFCNEVDTSGLNAEIYTKLFETLDDDNLIKICKKFKIYAPNGSKVKIDHMHNIQLLRKYGYEPFQHLWLTDPVTGAISRTKKKHLVLPGPAKRQIQAWEKKVSIPKHNRRLDKLTGAVTGSGVSKGSSFSSPQVLIADSQGYKMAIRELINPRGGNIKAGQVIDRQIRQFGSSSQYFEGMEQTNVKSTMTLKAFQKAKHIGSTLGERSRG